MAKKRHTVDQIIHKLREAEVALSKKESLSKPLQNSRSSWQTTPSHGSPSSLKKHTGVDGNRTHQATGEPPPQRL